MIREELPGRGLQLLLMGAAAHEVECEGHVGLQDRRAERGEAEAQQRIPTAADLDRLFRGA